MTAWIFYSDHGKEFPAHRIYLHTTQSVSPADSLRRIYRNIDINPEMIYYLKNRTGETFVESLKKSVAAGLMIGIGCIVYLSLESKIAGALLFSVGLFLICSFGMFLFTGKIGYIIKTGNKPNCAVIWLGNLFGSIAVSVIARIAKPSLH